MSWVCYLYTQHCQYVWYPVPLAFHAMGKTTLSLSYPLTHSSYITFHFGSGLTPSTDYFWVFFRCIAFRFTNFAFHRFSFRFFLHWNSVNKNRRRKCCAIRNRRIEKMSFDDEMMTNIHCDYVLFNNQQLTNKTIRSPKNSPKSIETSTKNRIENIRNISQVQ